MAETLDRLLHHLDAKGPPAKVVVWAHNSHLGDARATDMGRRQGEWNLGQLARELYGEKAVNVGFTTYTGTVTAANDWGDPAQRMNVRPGMPGSWEALFHLSGMPTFILTLRHRAALSKELLGDRLERAIGVIYRPDTERMSHYFHAQLSGQFDFLVHIDTTGALVPLEKWAAMDREAPETFPAGV
jgi:erythromycin esterase-like protein